MASVTDELLEKEFEEFSITIDSSDIMDKLKQLCQMYRISPENLVNEWVAFCNTKKRPTKRITLETLEHLEREKLSKMSHKLSGRGILAPQIYTSDNLPGDDDDDDELNDSYATPNSKNLQKKRQHTPEMAANKRVSAIGRSPGVMPSPRGNLSPSTVLTPSQRYGSRNNAGEVICSFGLPDNSTLSNWKRRPTENSLDIRPFKETSTLKEAYKFMFQKTVDKAFELDHLINKMGKRLMKQHLIEDFAHAGLPAQEPVTVVGRICCDSNGKLNASSLLLEGSREISAGRQVALDVSNVPQYSLFPGQIVAVDGINSTGQKFMASKVHEGVKLQQPEMPTLTNGGFNAVIAAGPFSTTDNILCEPLADLRAYLEKGSAPDLCIIFGPFVDAKHPLLEKGDIELTYEQLFRQLLDPLIQTAVRLKIHLVIVPSSRDLYHDYIYPQPPYVWTWPKEKDEIKNFVHFVSDPCTLVVDGVVIGLTSTDVLFHIGAEEISSAQQHQVTDRISRLVTHILTQHNYYPLYPPHADVPVDLEHFGTNCKLHTLPHLMVLPSDLRCFIKDVDSVVCINPGRMAKGQVGGTFTRLQVKPRVEDSDSFAKYVSAEIVRI